MLKILNVNRDGHTGHVSVEVQHIEPADNNQFFHGAVETIGIDALAILANHKGNVKEWLKHEAKGVKDRHIGREAAFDELQKLTGQTLDFEEPNQ